MITFDKEANSKINILLVDDQQEMAKVTGMMLKIYGFQVQTCHSGADCIRLAEESNPDVILLDIGMPVMDGFSVCQHIREQFWGKNLTIIALTGYDDEDYKGRKWTDCFDERLIKPVAHETLATKVMSFTASKLV